MLKNIRLMTACTTTSSKNKVKGERSKVRRGTEIDGLITANERNRTVRL